MFTVLLQAEWGLPVFSGTRGCGFQRSCWLPGWLLLDLHPLPNFDSGALPKKFNIFWQGQALKMWLARF